ncbi:3-methylcrotonyl-CoA carboxylase, partial [Rhodopseudomonas pseudopalustris]
DAARAEAPTPWRSSGWMPVGRRKRGFVFRHGRGHDHTDYKVQLAYGTGPATLTIDGRDLAFASRANGDG